MVSERVSRDSAVQLGARGVVNNCTSGSVKSTLTQWTTCKLESVMLIPLLTTVVGGQFVATAWSTPLKIGVQGPIRRSARKAMAWKRSRRDRTMRYFMCVIQFASSSEQPGCRYITSNGGKLKLF